MKDERYFDVPGNRTPGTEPEHPHHVPQNQRVKTFVVAILCVTALLWAWAPQIAYAAESVAFIARHWTWGLFISPAFGFFDGALLSAVILPLYGCRAVFTLRKDLQSEGPGTLHVTGTLAVTTAILVGLSFVAGFTADLNFPLIQDGNTLRLRMVPFLPLQWLKR